MLDLSGHEKHTVAPTHRRKLGWLGRAWRATCECGWLSSHCDHPIDASMAATKHAAEEARLRPTL